MSKVIATHDGWFSPEGAVAFGAEPKDGWRVGAGDRFVLCLFSSSRPDPRRFDAGVFNDELVLELDPQVVKEGAEIALAAWPVRYQQGSTVLTYLSRSVSGTLRISAVSKKKVAGEVELVAREPLFDPQARGEVGTRAVFDVEKL